MGKDSGGGGSTTTVQKADPWSGVQPFLLGSQTTRLKPGVAPIYKTEQVWNPNGTGGTFWNGGDGGDGSVAWETKNVLSNPESDFETVGQQGIYPEALRLYQIGGWNPEMQGIADTWTRDTTNRLPSQLVDGYKLAAQVNSGAFDPKITATGKVQAQSVDPVNAFASLGNANPMGAISQMLTGNVDTSSLGPVISNAARRIGENFAEQALPALRQGAIMSGQYGGTRQGISEGLASRGLAYSIGDMASNLYNNAYQQAQQQRYGTANNMAELGVSNARSDADRDLMAQSKNADIQLQNNAQQMALQNQLLSNRMQGMNALQGVNALQDSAYNRLLNLAQMPNEYNWNNLNNYSSIVQNGARMGGTTSTQQPYFTNPLGNAIGLGIGGLGLYNGLVNAGLLGGAGGAGAAAAGAATATGATDLIDAMALLA
jgi:hypothetical protein